MSEHTKEPWETAGNCARTKHTADGGGIFVADCWRKWAEPAEFAFDGSEAEANARRIVACVNACAGMGDPDEEIKNLRRAAKHESDCAGDAYSVSQLGYVVMLLGIMLVIRTANSLSLDADRLTSRKEERIACIRYVLLPRRCEYGLSSSRF